MEAALEALIKISEVNKYREIEETDPELFTLIYDEIASIFFSRSEYPDAAYYYEQAIRIKIKLNGMKHPKIAFGLLALGYLFPSHL
jgi:hypothetical protein